MREGRRPEPETLVAPEGRRADPSPTPCPGPETRSEELLRARLWRRGGRGEPEGPAEASGGGSSATVGPRRASEASWPLRFALGRLRPAPGRSGEGSRGQGGRRPQAGAGRAGQRHRRAGDERSWTLRFAQGRLRPAEARSGEAESEAAAPCATPRSSAPRRGMALRPKPLGGADTALA